MKPAAPGLWLAAALALPGCGDDAEPNPSPPGVAPAPHVGKVTLPPKQTPQAEPPGAGDLFDDQGWARDDDWSTDGPGDTAAQGSRRGAGRSQGQPTKAPAESADAARDLGQELAALLQPVDCLDLSEQEVHAGRQLDIRVEAVVLPSGRIQGASARVNGQPREALSCLEQQLERGRLGAPVEDAPRRVSGQRTMEVQRAPAATDSHQPKAPPRL